MKRAFLKNCKRILSLLLVSLMVMPMMFSFGVPVTAEDEVCVEPISDVAAYLGDTDDGECDHSWSDWVENFPATEESRYCYDCYTREYRANPKIIAYPVKGGNIYFDPITGAIIDCDESVINANIPATINGIDVTSIGWGAFRDCELLTSITIPNSVTNIDSYVFYDCSSLMSIMIPDGVTFMGGFTFSGCTSLKSIIIPDSVTEILLNGIFDDCESLKYIYYRGSEEEWNESNTEGTDLLSDYGIEIIFNCSCDTFAHTWGEWIVTEPGCVTEGEDKHVCLNCGVFESFSTPATGHRMGEWVITIEPTETTEGEKIRTCINCDEFEMQAVPRLSRVIEYLVEGGNIYFDSDTGTIIDCDDRVTKADIPSQINGVSVTSIGDAAFKDCRFITSVIIPDGVTSIGDYAFESCVSLISVTIPNGITSIGNSAFYRCALITSLEIPNSVTSIDRWAFAECVALTEINIPDGISNIGAYTFWYCSALASITIPNSVTSIDDFAFFSCISLESITIPDSVVSLGFRTFYGCTSLTSIIIPDSVTSIGNEAFNWCSSLASITLPNSVTSIGERAFGWCELLVDVWFEGTKKQAQSITIGDYNETLINAMWHYKSCTSEHEWGKWEISINPTAEKEGERIRKCSVCDDIERQQISISDVAVAYPVEGGNLYFDKSTGTIIDCDNSVTAAVIPNVIDGVYVTEIGYRAFYYSDLEIIVIPEGVTTIGDYAFYFCTSLTSINLPNNIKSIGEYAFGNCNSLTSIVIPEGITNIGDSTFYRCSSLTSITLPDSVTYIDYHAFYWCSSLKSIVIPNTVRFLGSYALYDCESLEYIYYRGTEEEWNAIDIEEQYLSSSGSEIIFNYNCDVSGHTWGELNISTEPTCNNEGEGIRTCLTCKVTETQTIPATGEHVYGEWAIVTPATCEFPGEEIHSCANCDTTESREIAPIAHTECYVEAKVATCVDNGNSEYYYCSVCGYHRTSDGMPTNAKNIIIPATGEHTYGEWIVTVEPTTDATGEQTRQCANCEATETEEIAKIVVENPFIDIKPDQWYTSGILWCYEKGYMAGVSETEFGRKSNVTRAMFVTILAKIDGVDLSAYEGKTSFTDVAVGKWYSAAIEWAFQNGYTSGLAEGFFGYKSDVTREQLATFFYTYSEAKAYDVSGRAEMNGYTDLNRIHSWALDALSWAVDAGLISGTSATTLAPRASATRAELALIVKNYVENVKNK